MESTESEDIRTGVLKAVSTRQEEMTIIKKAIRRHMEKDSHRMTGIHFQKDSILIQPILIRDIHMREIRDMVRVRRKKSSAVKIILIICILVIGLPIVVPTALGLLLAAFGVLVALAISAIAIWVAAVATAAVGILLGIHGFGQLFYSPALGIGMLGVGCLLLALGAVFTVLIGWGCIKLIPMMFRGFVNLCRIPFQKKRGECR